MSFFKDINSNIYVQNLIWQSFLINISINNYSELEEKVFEIINHFDNYQNNLRTIDMNYYLQSQILPKVDSASMANSLEVRPPYLDERIIDFALGIDNASNFNFKKTKINLFKVLEKSEIKDITKQKKHGFAFPLEAWVLKNFNTIKDSDILYELNIGTNELTNSKYNSNSMRLMWSLIVIHNWIESNNLSFR